MHLIFTLNLFLVGFVNANEMNKNPHLSNKLQFDYFINTIRKRKRFSKWIKQTELDDIEAVKEYYGYSNDKARQVLSLLSNGQIEEIKMRVFKGGTKSRRKAK